MYFVFVLGTTVVALLISGGGTIGKEWLFNYSRGLVRLDGASGAGPTNFGALRSQNAITPSILSGEPAQ